MQELDGDNVAVCLINLVISDSHHPWITSSSHVVKCSILLTILEGVVNCCLAKMQFDTTFTFRVSFFVQSQNLGHMNLAERCYFVHFHHNFNSKTREKHVFDLPMQPYTHTG